MKNVNKEIFKRFKELENEFHNLCVTGNPHSRYYPDGLWRKFATSAQDLLERVFGQNSSYYQNFLSQYKRCFGNESHVRSLYAVFSSAKNDFEKGYHYKFDLLISREIFENFISLAKKTLDAKHKEIAAVLACAALEDALKRYATANGLEIADKTMTEVINNLKTKGLVSGGLTKLLDSMPKIRNYVMHAQWDKVSELEIGSVIGLVEQLLISKFSPS